MKYLFLGYIISNWHYHVSKYGELEQDLFDLLDRLLKPNAPYISAFIIKDCPGKVYLLHITATRGLAAYLNHLIDLGQDANCLDIRKRTPLHLAARQPPPAASIRTELQTPSTM